MTPLGKAQSGALRDGSFSSAAIGHNLADIRTAIQMPHADQTNVWDMALIPPRDRHSFAAAMQHIGVMPVTFNGQQAKQPAADIRVAYRVIKECGLLETAPQPGEM